MKITIERDVKLPKITLKEGDLLELIDDHVDPRKYVVMVSDVKNGEHSSTFCGVILQSDFDDDRSLQPGCYEKNFSKDMFIKFVGKLTLDTRE